MTKLGVWLTVFLHRWELYGSFPIKWWERPIRWSGRAQYVVRRWLRGARSVDCDSPTPGEIDEPGLSICWGGMCPVQGEGEVDGLFCYYRSRGEGWQFHVAATSDDLFDNDLFVFERRGYFFPDGGYVSHSVSERCIREAVTAFRCSGPHAKGVAC